MNDLKPLAVVKNLDAIIYRYVYRALLTCDWNRSQTAKKLGVSLRTVHNYIAEIRRLGYQVVEKQFSRSLLSDDDVKRVFALLKSGETNKYIASVYGVSPTVISRIKCSRRRMDD